MSRAMTQFERNDAGEWYPTGVWLATLKRLQARMLPGDASRDAFMRYVLADASRPRKPFTITKGTWEDWIEWAVWSLTDGHIRMMVEVKPEVSLDALYAVQVLGEREGKPLSDPRFVPQAETPSLTGYKATELKGGIGGR